MGHYFPDTQYKKVSEHILYRTSFDLPTTQVSDSDKSLSCVKTVIKALNICLEQGRRPGTCRHVPPGLVLELPIAWFLY